MNIIGITTNIAIGTGIDEFFRFDKLLRLHNITATR